MTVSPDDPSNGVLNFNRALRSFALNRLEPMEELRPWIDSYWEVSWNLPTGVVHRQTNLSHACFNAAVESDGAWLYGVPGPTFVREISGSGRVFGVKFHPGAFYPWLGEPLNPFFDRRVPLAEAMGGKTAQWAATIMAESDFGKRSALADEFWLDRCPALPGLAGLCARRIAEDRTILRVGDACAVLGYDVRSLQRMFRREVGIAPKEMIRRYRLMEAAERLAKEPSLSGSDLALSLGYADQAHFIRDFKAVTGEPPETYRKRQDTPRFYSPYITTLTL